MSDEAVDLPTRGNFVFVTITAACGMIGGVAVCILNLDWSWANIVLGAIAGFTGVVILNVDKKDWLRLMTAAFFCGLYPRPVFDLGKHFIDQRQAIKQSESLKTSAAQIPSQPDNLIASAIQRLVGPGNEALEKAATLQNAATRSKVDSDFAEVISMVDKVADRKPEAAIQAAAKWRATASDTGSLHVVHQLDTLLKRISSDPKQPSSIKLKAANILANDSGRKH